MMITLSYYKGKHRIEVWLVDGEYTTEISHARAKQIVKLLHPELSLAAKDIEARLTNSDKLQSNRIVHKPLKATKVTVTKAKSKKVKANVKSA